MFEYFPDNYQWSLSVMICIGCGGAISEVDKACRSLREMATQDDRSAQEDWYENWSKVAGNVARLAVIDEKAGNHLSAGW